MVEIIIIAKPTVMHIDQIKPLIERANVFAKMGLSWKVSKINQSIIAISLIPVDFFYLKNNNIVEFFKNDKNASFLN